MSHFFHLILYGPLKHGSTYWFFFTDFQACIIFHCRDTFHSVMRSTISYWPFGSLPPLDSREQYCYHSYTASIWTSAFNSLEGKWVKLANHIVLFILGIPQLSHSRNIHIPSSHVNTFPISPLFKPMHSIVMSSWFLKKHKGALVGLKSRCFWKNRWHGTPFSTHIASSYSAIGEVSFQVIGPFYVFWFSVASRNSMCSI